MDLSSLFRRRKEEPPGTPVQPPYDEVAEKWFGTGKWEEPESVRVNPEPLVGGPSDTISSSPITPKPTPRVVSDELLEDSHSPVLPTQACVIEPDPSSPGKFTTRYVDITVGPGEPLEKWVRDVYRDSGPREIKRPSKKRGGDITGKT